MILVALVVCQVSRLPLILKLPKISKSYFAEHFFCRTNLRGFHYFAFGACDNYQVITILNNYYTFDNVSHKHSSKKLKVSQIAFLLVKLILVKRIFSREFFSYKSFFNFSQTKSSRVYIFQQYR